MMRQGHWIFWIATLELRRSLMTYDRNSDHIWLHQECSEKLRGRVSTGPMLETLAAGLDIV